MSSMMAWRTTGRLGCTDSFRRKKDETDYVEKAKWLTGAQSSMGRLFFD